MVLKIRSNTPKDGTILRAPKDFEGNEDKYGWDYWLDQANQLGI